MLNIIMRTFWQWLSEIIAEARRPEIPSEVLKGYEYHDHYVHHQVPGLNFTWTRPQPEQAQVFFFLYFLMTGVHAIHLSIGIVLIGRLTLVGVKRELPLMSPEIQVTALYWHLVDIIWIVLYPLLYLAGRSNG